MVLNPLPTLPELYCEMSGGPDLLILLLSLDPDPLLPDPRLDVQTLLQDQLPHKQPRTLRSPGLSCILLTPASLSKMTDRGSDVVAWFFFQKNKKPIGQGIAMQDQARAMMTRPVIEDLSQCI